MTPSISNRLILPSFNSTMAEVDFSALPHVNQVDRRDYRTYYDATLQAQVEKLWQADIEAFQYEFESADS